MLSWSFMPLWRTSSACVGVRVTAGRARRSPSFPVCSVECKVPPVSRCAVWSVPGPAASRRYRSRSQAVVSSRAQRQHSPAAV